MSPRVRFEDQAEAEYRLAGRYYEQRRANLGIEFFDAVDETIDRILEHPQSGSAVPSVPSDLLVRRRAVTRFPYHIVYLEMAHEIRVLAVAHDRRRPGYWMDRVKPSP